MKCCKKLNTISNTVPNTVPNIVESIELDYYDNYININSVENIFLDDFDIISNNSNKYEENLKKLSEQIIVLDIDNNEKKDKQENVSTNKKKKNYFLTILSLITLFSLKWN